MEQLTPEPVRVLVVEDDGDHADLLRAAFSQDATGHDVRIVDSLAGAWEALADHSHNVVVADVRLPDGVGTELIDGRGAADHPPVVIMTSFADEQAAVEAIKSGAIEYIVKSPETLAGMPAIVQRVLRESRNVRARRDAERERVNAALEWRATFDGISDAIMVVTPDGMIRRCNRAMVTLLGRRYSEIIGQRCYRLLHGTDDAPDGCPLVAAGKHLRREVMQTEMEGRWWRVSVDPVLDDLGELRSLVHTMTDITESVQADRRRKAMTFGLQQVLDTADELMACPDLDTLYRRAVELARERLGVERCSLFLVDGEEIVGTYGTRIDGTTSDERVARGKTELDWWRALPPAAPGDARWVRFDGPAMEWVDGEYDRLAESWTVVTPVCSGEKLIGVLYNDAAISGGELHETLQNVFAVYATLLGSIIERKRGEDELRGHERQLQDALHLNVATIETIPLALLVLDGDLNVLMANRRFVEQRHVETDGGIGRSVEEIFDIDLEPTQGEIMARIREAAWTRGQAEILGVRHVSEHHEPRLFDIRVSGVRMSRADGQEETRVLLVTEDVTHQRLLEERARERSKLESVGTLAGGVAHDFNNILTGIGGYTELIADDVEHLPSASEDLAHVRGLVDRAAALVTQLLAFSRRQPLARVVIDTNALVQDTIRLLRRLIGEDIDLRFTPADEPCLVDADPGQMEQILMNLAVNARDAMPGGGELEIRTAPVKIDSEDVAESAGPDPGNYVALAVSDSGVGMADGVREHIFEPFYTT